MSRGKGTVYLVRHAHADWSLDEARPLSPRGRADADGVADLLEPRGVRAIVSSPSARALQTVQPLAERLAISIQLDADLRERELSPRRVEHFEAAVEATWRDFDFAHAGGESNRAAQARVRAAIERILQRADDVVAVATHGNALALLLNSYELPVGYEFWLRMSFPDVFEVRFDEGRPSGFSRIWSP